MTIAEKFWKSGLQPPIANTVGELRDLLTELPTDLPLVGTFEVAVFNCQSPHREGGVCVISEVDSNDDDTVNISGLDFEV